MGQTGICPIPSHGTMGGDGYRDTYIHSEWDRLGYVPYFPMVQWEGTDIGVHTFIVDETDWDMSHSYLLEHSRMYSVILVQLRMIPLIT